MVRAFLARHDSIFHVSTQVRYNRAFDFASKFPFLGWLGFDATENFPSTKFHVLRAIFQQISSGSFWTRLITCGQQSLTTLDAHTAVVNLAAESNMFEVANRNQIGTYFGRALTNTFRLEHRLSVDESIVRTFMTSPASTLVNNGCEHVLKCLAKHWRNMLYQEHGNFAHQRMEQLNPFEVLRFHLTTVLVTLTNLRGRNTWDSNVLGPYLKTLQSFDPSSFSSTTARKSVEDGNSDDEITEPCVKAASLVKTVIDSESNMIANICGGIPSRMNALREWLEALEKAIQVFKEEAGRLKLYVNSVASGIDIGYSVAEKTRWTVPSQNAIEKALIAFLGKKHVTNVPTRAIINALDVLAPKDKRMLEDMVTQHMHSYDVCKLLIKRSVSLIEREIRRQNLNDTIQELTAGSEVSKPEVGTSYLACDTQDGNWRLILPRKKRGNFIHAIDVDTGFPVQLDTNSTTWRKYLYVGEAISRAKQAFMTIELQFGERFQYNAFAELGSAQDTRSLRSLLMRLTVVAQLHCEVLDNARLNVMAEVRSSSGANEGCKPQSALIIGGGPTGLLCAIHSCQSILSTGGSVTVYEKRDGHKHQSAAFERAQIVRLDSRQISMLRFHLGTDFESCFVPLRGETDPHQSNVVPNQGFVEVTIKRMEAMLAQALIKMKTKGLVQYYSEGEAQGKSIAAVCCISNVIS
jgi:hypothetical protein